MTTSSKKPHPLFYYCIAILAGIAIYGAYNLDNIIQDNPIAVIVGVIVAYFVITFAVIVGFLFKK